jgi:hypothetical protein
VKDRQQIHPWDRQEGETPAAYRAFEVYLHLGYRRTLDRAYAAAQKGQMKGSKRATAKRAPGRWTHWSQVNDWRDRAGAWDDHLACQAREGFAEALAEDGGEEGRRVVRRYRALLEELCGAAAELIAKARKRLKEQEDSGPAEAQMLRSAGEVLGRANRDLLIILGNAALDGGGGDEPGTKATPEPLDLRQAMRPPEAIQ